MQFFNSTFPLINTRHLSIALVQTKINPSKLFPFFIEHFQAYHYTAGEKLRDALRTVFHSFVTTQLDAVAARRWEMKFETKSNKHDKLTPNIRQYIFRSIIISTTTTGKHRMVCFFFFDSQVTRGWYACCCGGALSGASDKNFFNGSPRFFVCVYSFTLPVKITPTLGKENQISFTYPRSPAVLLNFDCC